MVNKGNKMRYTQQQIEDYAKLLATAHYNQGAMDNLREQVTCRKCGVYRNFRAYVLSIGRHIRGGKNGRGTSVAWVRAIRDNLKPEDRASYIETTAQGRVI